MLISLPAADSSYDYHFFGQVTDGIILMNYDEHWSGRVPRPSGVLSMVCRQHASNQPLGATRRNF